MENLVQKIAENSANAIQINEDDYLQDGLLYCGKCHTPKQKEVVFCGKKMKPPMLCECETRRRDEEKAEAKRQKQLQYIENLRKTGIQDEKILSYCFDYDNTPQSKYSKAFRRYCDKWEEMYKRNIGLILFGGVGTGKSFYSGCIANEIIKRYAVPVIVTSIPRILNQLFNITDKNGYIGRLANVPLLVIDDLGAERETDYALEQVYTVIDERYKANKPLIVTTNLSWEELKNPTDIRYKRIFDRVREMCTPFNISGVSRREQRAKEKARDVKALLLDDDF